MTGGGPDRQQLPYDRHGKLTIIDPARTERILIAGDIHGDLRTFNRIMSLIGPGDLAVFLGDYADRGPSGLEVIEGLMAARRKMPGNILALKGNHED
ncbi:MAG: serine/threonine protein phosphatase, partial [Spirochaetales bacterium]|nr:serine/threonine protein phosphatase [Spirochaetales bacterium]